MEASAKEANERAQKEEARKRELEETNKFINEM